MSAPDPYEQHRAAFGAELRRAAPRVGKQRRRRFVTLGGATVALAGAATAVVIIAPTTGSRLDVLAEARAAISKSTDSIVHYSLIYTSNYPQRAIDVKRSAGCGGRPGEMWIATADGPPRYRFHLPMDRCHVNVIGDRIATGGFDIAYGDRTSRIYSADDGFERVVTGLPAVADEQAPPLPIGDSRFSEGDARDPVAKIRSLLGEGKLRDAGPVRGPDDRMLRRLVGTYSENRGDPAAPRKSKVSVDYRVDATTFAPVLISTTREASVPKNPDVPFGQTPMVHKMITDKVRFLIYETLPLTPQNEALLTVEPKPGTDIETEQWTSKMKAPPKPSNAEQARAKTITDAQIAAGTRLRAEQ